MDALENAKQAIKKGHRLTQEGFEDAALEVFTSAADAWPKNAWVHLELGKCACNLGHYKAGLKALHQACELAPERPTAHAALARWQVRLNDPDAARTVENAAQAFPDDPVIKSLADRLTGQDDQPEQFTADAEYLRRAIDQRAQSPIALSKLVSQSRSQLTLEQRLEFERELAENNDNPVLFSRYATALIEAKRYSQALQVLKDDTSEKSMMAKAVCFAAVGDYDRAESAFREHVSQTTKAGLIAACLSFLDRAADLQAALPVIARLKAQQADDAVSHVLAFAQSIGPARRHLDQTPEAEAFTLSDHDGCGIAVLVFAAHGERTGVLSQSLINRFFASHGVAVGSLVDRDRHFFWSGVHGLGTDVDSAANQIRARLNARGINKVYTLGSSAGGVGAIVYGNLLQADGILAFSAPSDVRQSFLQSVPDHRAKLAIRSVNTALEPGQLNLKSWLAARTQRVQTQAYYCAQEHRDRVQAENLQDFPEFNIHPIDGFSTHESIGPALATGQLLREFQKIVSSV